MINGTWHYVSGQTLPDTVSGIGVAHFCLCIHFPSVKLKTSNGSNENISQSFSSFSLSLLQHTRLTTRNLSAPQMGLLFFADCLGGTDLALCASCLCRTWQFCKTASLEVKCFVILLIVSAVSHAFQP